MTHRSFVLHGRDDILNTTIGRPKHPGRVRVAGIGVTIIQYFGHASCDSNTSSASIHQKTLAEIIGNLKEKWRTKVEDENKNLQEAWRKKVEIITYQQTPYQSNKTPILQHNTIRCNESSH